LHRWEENHYLRGMKRKILLVLALGFFTCCPAQNVLPRSARMEADTVQRYSSHTLIIFYGGKKSKSRLLKAVRRYGAKPIYVYNNFSGMAICLPEGKKLEEAIAYFRKVKGVVSVNRDYVYKLD
jgi:hypothetical protein